MFAPSSLDPLHDMPVIGAPIIGTSGVPMGTSRRDRLAEFVHHLSDVPMHDARRAVNDCRALVDDDPLAVVAAALLSLRREAGRLQPV